MPSSATILIAEDSDAARILLQDQMHVLGYATVVAANGREALDRLHDAAPDLLLLDVNMPVMNGYEVLDRMRRDPELRAVPVVVISALADVSSMVRCIERGADDYLIKPYTLALLEARIGTSLGKKRLADREVELRTQLADHNLNLERRVREQVQKITSAQLATIFALSKLAESRDPETGAHLERMRVYAHVLAAHLRRNPRDAAVIDEQFLETLYQASPLHDIGKVGVADRILLKPGRLDADERARMEEHCLIGADTLRAVHEQHPGNPIVQMGMEIAESHHEKWDGSGYPNGLVGEAIPLTGRIVALADAYDALASKRVYKNALSHEESRRRILVDRAAHFDPAIVDAFLDAEAEFVSVRRSMADS